MPWYWLLIFYTWLEIVIYTITFFICIICSSSVLLQLPWIWFCDDFDSYKTVEFFYWSVILIARMSIFSNQILISKLSCFFRLSWCHEFSQKELSLNIVSQCIVISDVDEYPSAHQVCKEALLHLWKYLEFQCALTQKFYMLLSVEEWFC